nr:hypothetical protein [Micromonospora sp. DSM 115978]
MPYRFGEVGRAGGAGGGGTGRPPRGRGAGADDPGYPLAGRIFCGSCDLPLNPIEMLGGRAYGSPCGCRLTVVAADAVERLVYDAVLTREPTTADPADPADLIRRHVAEVRLGGTLDDLHIIWRV